MTEKNEYKVSQVFIYPVKSLGGISLPEAELTDRGFKYDRRWMLIDREGQFLSQRRVPDMALLQAELDDEYLSIVHKHKPELNLQIPLALISNSNSGLIDSYMWDESIGVAECGEDFNEWFSDVLKTKCRLVCMPDNSNRPVDVRFAGNNEITSLSDGYPFLIIGQESLNLLNSKLDEPLPVNRFRPNIVFAGGLPHDEDEFDKFEIGGVLFKRVKPCARCTVITINQNTGERKQEPLKTLATYRKVNNKILFGQNLLHEGDGEIRVGDKIIPV